MEPTSEVNEMEPASFVLHGEFFEDRKTDAYDFIVIPPENNRDIKIYLWHVGWPVFPKHTRISVRGHYSGPKGTWRSVSQKEIKVRANFIRPLDLSRSAEENRLQAERELTQIFMVRQIVLTQEIEEKAFELHQQNPSRSAEENWLEAEAELLGLDQS